VCVCVLHIPHLKTQTCSLSGSNQRNRHVNQHFLSFKAQNNTMAMTSHVSVCS